MPEQERPVIFKGGPTKAGREGRAAETKWLQDWKRANEARGRLTDGLRELERFKVQLEDEVKTVRGRPDDLRRYLDEIEQRKNAIREEHEQLRDLVLQNEDLYTERLTLDQYVTPQVKSVTEEVNRLISIIEGTQEVQLDGERLKTVFRNAPPPPPPPSERPAFDMEATQRFTLPEQEMTPEMSLEQYQREVRSVLTEAFQVLKLLRERGVDDKVRSALREEPDRLEARLKELDEKAGSPEYDVRQDAANIIDGVRLLLEEPASPPTARAAVARRRVPKGSSFVAWMPRVPAPPYVKQATATLAAAPPPPAPSGNASPAMDEEAALASLETSLREFNEEKDRLLAQHKAVVDGIQERIRERKLQALRDTLNTPA